MTILVIAVVLALSISFLCSLTEATLLSLSLADIAHLTERHPVVGRIWRGFRDNIHKPISIILIVNTLANTMGASFAGAKFSEIFGSHWVVAFSLLLSFAIFQWSEILPKTIAVRYNRLIAQFTGIPLKAVERVLGPVLVVVEFLNKPFQRLVEKKSAFDAVQELAILARFASLNRLITNQQAGIVSQGISLSQSIVRDLMVKRTEVKFLSTTMTLTDALVASHVHHHTRYLLAEGNDIEKIVGYVNFKDVVSALQINPKDPSLAGIKRPVLTLSDTDNLAAALRAMTMGHHHIALVKDAAGRTAGLITLEDIIETFIGQIQDEYDILPHHAYAIAEGRFLVGGGITLQSLREKTGADVPAGATTVDEWIRTSVLNRLPDPEEKMVMANAEFVVKKTRRSRIFELTMAIKAPVKA